MKGDFWWWFKSRPGSNRARIPYRLQDPTGRELLALVHGNRLIPAKIRTTDELRKLWASPATKDALRKRSRPVELVPSDPENTEALDQLLRDSADIPQADGTESDDVVPGIQRVVVNDGAPVPLKIRLDLKRMREPETFDEITVGELRQSKRPRHPKVLD